MRRRLLPRSSAGCSARTGPAAPALASARAILDPQQAHSRACGWFRNVQVGHAISTAMGVSGPSCRGRRRTVSELCNTLRLNLTDGHDRLAGGSSSRTIVTTESITLPPGQGAAPRPTGHDGAIWRERPKEKRKKICSGPVVDDDGGRNAPAAACALPLSLVRWPEVWLFLHKWINNSFPFRSPDGVFAALACFLGRLSLGVPADATIFHPMKIFLQPQGPPPVQTKDPRDHDSLLTMTQLFSFFSLLFFFPQINLTFRRFGKTTT